MRFAILGALSAFVAVLAGAFGAHALRQDLDATALSAYETAVRYQIFHALALLFVSWAATQYSHRAIRASGWLFAIGTLLFCGSLYGMALTGDPDLAAWTPIGGLAFLMGWLLLALGLARGPRSAAPRARVSEGRNWDIRRRFSKADRGRRIPEAASATQTRSSGESS